jgi:hypothetical protein
VAGLVFTARVIDKLRGTLDEGHVGPYIALDGLSSLWARYTKIPLQDLRATIARAESEREVEVWIEERIGHLDVDRFNTTFAAFSTTMIPEQWRATFEERHPEDLRLRHLNTFDLLDADDDRFYGERIAR